MTSGINAAVGLGAAGAAWLDQLEALESMSETDAKKLVAELLGGAGLSKLLGTEDKPDLPLAQCSLSLETLLDAVSEKSRKNSIESALDSIETNAAEQEIQGEKRLEEIKKQLDAAHNESIWSKFAKAFKIIGAIFGAIASAATIALGAVTGNPLLIAAGAMSALMTVDSLASTISDGKYSLAAGFSELGKAMGMSDDAAQWFGFGLNLGVMLAGTALSFGAAGVSGSAKIAQTATDATVTIARTSTAANIGQGISGIGTAATDAGIAVAKKEAADAEANKIDINAILERLRSAQETNEKFIELSMQTLESLMGAVKEIVSDCAEATTSILAGTPSMA